jgi:hypothetical protein
VLPPVIAAVVYRVVHEAVRNVVARRCEPHRPARRAQRVGRRAVGYLLNDAEPEDLIRAVRAAAAGDAPLDPRAARELLAEQSGRPARELSKRERQILALVAAGHANKVIAVRLEQAIDRTQHAVGGVPQDRGDRSHASGAVGPAIRTCLTRRVSRPVAFWLVAFAFAVTMFATTLPSPLYPAYEARFRFGSLMVTVIYAVFASGVLGALLTERRPHKARSSLAGASGHELVGTAARWICTDGGACRRSGSISSPSRLASPISSEGCVVLGMNIMCRAKGTRRCVYALVGDETFPHAESRPAPRRSCRSRPSRVKAVAAL